MKRILYILLLLTALLLTACGKENTQDPTVTTEPTTAPTTAPTEPAETEEEKFQKLINDNWWYSRALCCTFEKPEDISAWHYFYAGIGESGHDDYKYFTDEEIAFLAAAYKDRNGREETVMATRLPVTKINEGLSILDITLEDIEIPKAWVYYDKTDAYYFWVSDAYGVAGETVTRVEKGTNGMVTVYWENPSEYWNTQTGEPYPVGTKMVMTLQEKSDGSYTVLSNVPVQ